MNEDQHAVDEVLNEMAKVTAEYLDHDEVEKLIEQWQGFEQVSIKMMQQCILDTIRLFPQLRPYKPTIRRRFWQIIQDRINLSTYSPSDDEAQQSDDQQKADDLNDSLSSWLDEAEQGDVTVKEPSALIGSDDQELAYEAVAAFYTTLESITRQLEGPATQEVFTHLHQMVQIDRTLKVHSLNMVQFTYGMQPKLPADVDVLNHIMQLVYVCLCHIVGPAEADNILFNSAQHAKQHHPISVVESLF